MRQYCWLLVFISCCAFGQQDTTSTQLREVTVYGMPLSKYAAGTQVIKLDLDGTSFLQQVISSAPSLYLKSYGNDQLATVAYRGTSANHTAVMWNGMNISSPTLGVTDFTLLPSFLLDDVSLQAGTTSALYGSDALGGSVLIQQRRPLFKPATVLTAQTQAGSFGRYFAGLQGAFSTKRFELRTKVMERSLENNFKYDAPKVGYQKTQQNASVHTWGFDQQLHFQIKPNRVLSGEAMYTDNRRQIQPPVTNNNLTTLHDKNTRLSLSYDGEHAIGHVYTAFGYVVNNEVYQNDAIAELDKNVTKQLTVVVNVDRSVGRTTSIRYGGSASRYQAQADAYGNINEERYDVFASWNQYLTRFWNITFNARQSFYAGRTIPFTPSLGTEIRALKHLHHELKLRGQASRGYRVPTLNDRYWNPGGNPSLLPEDAWHAEGGMTWSYTANAFTAKVNASAYQTTAKHWILWQPVQSIWQPRNLDNVEIRGVEFSEELTYRFGAQWALSLSGNYSYTKADNRTVDEPDTYNKQLPYVPFHLAHGIAQVSYKQAFVKMIGEYTSRRFTTTDNSMFQSLDAYALFGASCGYTADVKSTRLALRFDANNIFNTYYETIQGLAMPGRNYSITLTIQYKNNHENTH